MNDNTRAHLLEPAIAARLAEKICSITSDQVSPEALQWAVIAVVDTLAVTYLGAPEPCTALLLDTPGIGDAPGPALFFGTARRGSMLDAALVNGTAAHALDYDDVSGTVGGHPSAPMVAPLFAIAEAEHRSGRDLLVAFMVGVEVQHRIGRGVNFHHYTKGWHPTATLGIFGTTAAAAHLLRLDRQQVAVALAIAASFAAGIKANFGTMTKPLHVGHTARSGLLAALLAQRGYTANPAAIEHKQGFLEVFNGRGTYDIDKMFTDIDAPIGLDPSLGLKQFPCCGSTHPAITMMLRLVKEEGITAADTAKIEILAQRNRLPHTNNPDPRSGLEAKFSIQYTTARALADGAVRLEHFEGEAHLDPHVRALMAITDTREHPDMPADGPNQFGSEVIVTTRDGRRLARRIDHLVGRGPDNPMSREELREKFTDCAKRVLAPSQCGALFEALMDLDAVDDIATLSRALEVH
jgi:2-methylcitrate dehydratase PrpD